jgi:hypothetical protein
MKVSNLYGGQLVRLNHMIPRLKAEALTGAVCMLLAACGAPDPNSTRDPGGAGASSGAAQGGSGGSGQAGGSTSVGGTSAGGSTSGGATSGGTANGGTDTGANGGTSGASQGGSAGSGATGGSVNHPPAEPCPDMDDSMVGEWQNIAPPGVHLEADYGGFNTGTLAFVLDPNDSRIVYLGTHGQGIYKSSDCGSTWAMVNTGANGDHVGSGRNWVMQTDPALSDIIYANSGYGDSGGFFKSTNGGVDWTQHLGPGTDFATYVPADFVEYVTIDPNNGQNILVSAHNACTGPYEGSGTCYATTTDGGENWTMLPAHPDMGYEAVAQVMLDANTWLYYGWGVFLTTNAGASWTKTINEKLVLNASGVQYKADDGNYYVPSDQGVLTSTDLVTWTKVPNSPNATALTGDGTTIFTSNNQVQSNFYYVSTGDYSTWDVFPAPEGLTKGANRMRYDHDHNLLYTSNNTGGFWRVQTK